MRLPNSGPTSLPLPPPASSSTSSFIMKVQHLIERCLTFDLDKQECVKALSKHAAIHPIVTITVWKELEKANMEFFEHYNRKRLARRASHYTRRRVLQDTINKLIPLESLEDVTRDHHKMSTGGPEVHS